MAEEYIHNEPLQKLRKRIAYLTEIKGYSIYTIAKRINEDRGNLFRASREDSTSRRNTLNKYSDKIEVEFNDDLIELLTPVKIPDIPPVQDNNKVTEQDFQLLTDPIKKLTAAIEKYDARQVRQQAMMELLIQIIGPLVGKTEIEIEKMLTDKMKEIESRQKNLHDNINTKPNTDWL